MEAALYLNHPYGRPVIGWRHEIEKLTRDDALAFYRRFYTPNNAILVVAGDVTADEVKTMAEETYGKVPRVTEIAPRVRPQEPEQDAPRTVTLADPRVTQPSVQRYYLVPSYTTAKPGEAEALDVLAHILGRGSNSRLYNALVVDKGIAVNAGAGYQGSALDDTRLNVSGIAEARHHVGAARGGDRRRDRRDRRQGRHRRRARSRQDPPDRRRRLCPGQPSHAGALVWRGAHHRRHGRAGAGLARPHPRG